MEKRRLGDSDLLISESGLGCNNFGAWVDQAEADSIVAAALDVGVNFFDTADVYGEGRSEPALGAALKGRRHEVIIATKFGLQMPGGKGGSRAWVMQSCEDSLRRLGMDHIDLYQMHRPDPATPIEETLAALGDLVTQGKVRWIGCSGFSGDQIRAARTAAQSLGIKGFVSSQDNYSLLVRGVEAEVLPACAEAGWGFLPYFPLVNGLLAGVYRRGEPPPKGSRLDVWGGKWLEALNDQNFDMIDRFTEFAEARGHSLLDLAIAWLLANPVLSSVIAGATSAAQVRANAAATTWRLTPEEARAVSAL